MITFKHVGKKYPDGFVALKDIDFHIEEGELVALIGPSGCGKTTTMKMINRLIEPSSGQIFINGEDISKKDPVKLRRDIGYVIQQIGLLPHMTIEDNITLVPRLKGWEKEQYSDKVDELLELVGLDPKEYRTRFPGELSGGQQQRVGVIRALAAEPPIILMDEPFSALDPISREQLQDELVKLQETIKKTIVFVTHDMDEAIKIADRIAILKDGEIIQFDTPERILRYPKNEFVKGFIGEDRLNDAENGQPAAADLMLRKVITARPGRGLAQALKTMKTYKVDSLFVVNGENELLGIATIDDVEKNYAEEEKTLGDIMSADYQSVLVDAPYNEVAELFAKGSLYIPVLEGGKLAGLITRSTMMRGLAGMKISSPAEGGTINE
ncbi:MULTISPECIES: ABC transporter ATP-binding protein [Bacillus]|uniref:Quaternary amine transport ATP-binding protein n=1 Tax=Bacillus infantis NRRL B-14911 TaxID=1367477 RepID=U5LHR6_9BACI|nr:MULTISPECIES: betaine/proline/choline family ABC transporter ATP-binding protein [Bacillus]OXT16974.1 glycine/betaine ABC transporter ATP-binding protein [Bacillus sp. OG2]AGX06147.1 glycine/betaine ABC transporter ATPase [Bacillus infantis NRRL B-14911]EAR65612.1 glycine betaine/carnitine/choline ABC transporter (ATP-binding protein) [Bacillus sp. NRRL B-14911]MCK6207805.1 betaine/proline/choline family ABC transporter ATP-binding protein [Bacillus infantis]MCP1160384.1 betaine/proline/cho